MRIPPGRAGQLWLRRRILVAEHGIDVLRRKQRLLRDALERRSDEMERARPRWVAACRDAERWMSRALATGGHEHMAVMAADAEPSHVSVEWEQLMGARVPALATARVSPSLLRTTASLGGSAAFDRTAEVAAVAVHAAVEFALASAAVAALDAELASTARRVRLLRRRRLPELEAALAESTRRLEEAERDDGVRIRWASRRAAAGRR